MWFVNEEVLLPLSECSLLLVDEVLPVLPREPTRPTLLSDEVRLEELELEEEEDDDEEGVEKEEEWWILELNEFVRGSEEEEEEGGVMLNS